MVISDLPSNLEEIYFSDKKIQHVINKLAEKVNIDEFLKKSSTLPKSDSFSWKSLSLYNGFPSLLFLFSELQKANLQIDYESEILNYFLVVKSILEKEGGLTSLSLFEGLTGICFSVHKAALQVDKLNKAKEKLNLLLFEKLENEFLPILDEYIQTNTPPPQQYYDLIYGAVGIGIYLSEIVVENSKAKLLLEKIIFQCIKISTPTKLGSVNRFLFFTPQYHLNSQERSFFKKGNYNLGISHGASGILAFLSKMYLEGVIVPAQKETIQRLLDWLYKQSFIYQDKVCWGVRCLDSDHKNSSFPSLDHLFRLGWCDGVSGILRSIYLASSALNDQKLKTESTNTLLDTISIFLEKKWLYSPTLCHGYTGLGLILSRMKQETGLEEFQFLEDRACKTISSFYHEDSIFGFSDISNLEPQNYHFNESDSLEKILEKIYSTQKVEVPQPGLLNGVIGIILFYLSRETLDYSWTKLFLI